MGGSDAGERSPKQKLAYIAVRHSKIDEHVYYYMPQHQEVFHLSKPTSKACTNQASLTPAQQQREAPMPVPSHHCRSFAAPSLPSPLHAAPPRRPAAAPNT